MLDNGLEGPHCILSRCRLLAVLRLDLLEEIIHLQLEHVGLECLGRVHALLECLGWSPARLLSGGRLCAIGTARIGEACVAIIVRPTVLQLPSLYRRHSRVKGSHQGRPRFWNRELFARKGPCERLARLIDKELTAPS